MLPTERYGGPMTANVRHLITDVETRLDPAQRETLAAIVDTFLATHDGPPPFTATEHDHLTTLDREPFEMADPNDVAALFARRLRQA